MNHIRAIGFDLFNTLITADPKTLNEAMSRLIHSLQESGLKLGNESFKEAHHKAAVQFVEKARRDGRETHNRFWISAALHTQGYNVPPDDPRIAAAVDAYFSAFFHNCYLIPGTKEMLGALKDLYRLGLLTNFTHAPAAREIIDRVDLTPFFDVVLISGDLVFRKLIERLGVEKNQILYVGDDPEPDITGAQRAGLQPVWTTYIRDKNLPFVPGVLSRVEEEPDVKVPRISTWKDLLSLLDKS